MEKNIIFLTILILSKMTGNKFVKKEAKKRKR